MSKERSREVRCAIRRVFLEVWDPIGIKDEPNAQDEYDGYLGRAFELLVAGAKDREIEDYLLWIVGRMGMDGSRTSHMDVIAAPRYRLERQLRVGDRPDTLFMNEDGPKS